ncbi:MAG TPA: phosphatase RsbU N-terminal domain-containing protein [Dermatophilaceae bacterium]|nr:phosphatase RsbU N-terminal domain-containing protein [Dermatophilaceae bacterium]
MNELDALTRDYRTAFLRYLPRREEVALTRGYELGRGAVTAGVSILDLTRIHHEILLDVLRDTRAEEIIDVASAAAEFLLEVLATYDMTQRRLLSGG